MSQTLTVKCKTRPQNEQEQVKHDITVSVKGKSASKLKVNSKHPSYEIHARNSEYFNAGYPSTTLAEMSYASFYFSWK